MFSKTRIILLIILLANSLAGLAQDTSRIIDVYDPNDHKIIPDKVFEIGLPLLVLFFIINAFVSVFRIKAENRLREKAIDKGISEATLIALFGEDKKLSNLVYLKWFLVLAALGISMLIIHALADYLQSQSGYLALGIITILQAIALFIYYLILKKR